MQACESLVYSLQYFQPHLMKDHNKSDGATKVLTIYK